MSDLGFFCAHTFYSLDGGPASPEDYVRLVAELGYRVLAVTDRGPLAVLPAFSAAVEHHGIAPLFGMEIDLLTGADGEGTQAVVLFAQDGSGLENLARIAGLAYAQWPSQSKALA